MQTFQMTDLIYLRHICWFFWHITISKTRELTYLNLYLYKTHYSIFETKSETLLYVK